MVMKSIFTVSYFVVMTLVIGTQESKIPKIKIFNLIREMTAACENPGNGTCERVNEVDFNYNCKKENYQNTFCQINHALLSCKGFNISRSTFSDFHEDNCTSKKNLIRLKEFCSKMLDYLRYVYGRCGTNNGKRV